MKNKLLVAFIGSLLTFSAGLALAQPGPHGGPGYVEARGGAPYRIQPRIDAQQREIVKGQRAGVLTRREVGILRDNLAQIKREFNRAKRDGFVSMEERARLDDMLDRNGRMIRHMENNTVTRF
jgi:hypothetical protein